MLSRSRFFRTESRASYLVSRAWCFVPRISCFAYRTPYFAFRISHFAPTPEFCLHPITSLLFIALSTSVLMYISWHIFHTPHPLKWTKFSSLQSHNLPPVSVRRTKVNGSATWNEHNKTLSQLHDHPAPGTAKQAPPSLETTKTTDTRLCSLSTSQKTSLQPSHWSTSSPLAAYPCMQAPVPLCSRK